MSLSTIFIPIILVLGLALLMRRVKPHHDPVHRLHPGVANKAEWMAAPDVVQQVISDYDSVQRWTASALMDGYPFYLGGLPEHYSGEALTEHSRVMLNQVRRTGTRLVGILEATHEIQVRRFSSDGRACYLFDRQTDQRMVTYDHRSKRKVSVQPLGSGLYVYRMVYDVAAKRWKIAELIQQLPVGCSITHTPTASVRLTDRLPSASGRDW